MSRVTCRVFFFAIVFYLLTNRTSVDFRHVTKKDKKRLHKLLRVYDSRDSSRQPAPSPSLSYSLTHAHRSIGYRNRNPQLLADSAARLMYSRVYDNRDSSHQSAPSPSLCSSLTHAHSTLPTPTLITITCTQVLWFLERLTRPAVSFCETTSVCEAF
jgi:hypothetical protein